ncbi:hypothetical protein Lser_V15G40314 [Lactuca serriola]
MVLEVIKAVYEGGRGLTVLKADFYHLISVVILSLSNVANANIDDKSSLL